MMKENLSERELEVLQLASYGYNKIEIGKRLYITSNTVKTHTFRIAQKLHSRNLTHAVAIAIVRGLIHGPAKEAEPRMPRQSNWKTAGPTKTDLSVAAPSE